MTNSPIEGKYLTIGPHCFHYLDEGSGATLLFVHGVPEWSMTYGEVIRQLSRSFRCIAVDHLGFGYSDKDERADLSSKGHGLRLLQVIRRLNLHNIHLVVHDFGGPIGTEALLGDPARFKSLTISNSWLWNLQGTRVATGLRLLSGRLGRWLYLQAGFELHVMARNLFANRAAYRQWYGTLLSVHRNEADRFANYQLVLEMLAAGKYYDSLAEQLRQLPIPGQLVWGTQDKLFDKSVYLAKWIKLFPHFKVVELSQCGHFPHMETPVDFAENLGQFVKNVP
jgi:haloalkane dehalogenase